MFSITGCKISMAMLVTTFALSFNALELFMDRLKQ